MNFDLRVFDVRGKGVLCTASSDTGDSFWLPRGEHIEWSIAPHPGTYVRADVPSWLAKKASAVSWRSCVQECEAIKP